MQKVIEFRAFILLLALVTLTFLALLAPFFSVIFWAVAIGVVFTPIQEKVRIKMKKKNENIISLITLGICLLVVVIPFLFIVISFVNQFITLYQSIESGTINLTVYYDTIKTSFPSIEVTLQKLSIDPSSLREKLSSSFLTAGRLLAEHAIELGQETINLMAQVGISLYLAFYMLRDSKKLINYLHLALPLGDEREALFFKKFAEVTRATLKGSLVVAAVQGSLGGFMFYALDINAFIFWGVIMMFFSLIPMVGAALIWGPVAIYYLVTGSYFAAFFMIFFGFGVIGLIDNILRPILVGRDTNLPDYLVLLSTLGGFVLFGMNGFVLGPLVAVLFIATWDIFIKEFNVDTLKEDHLEQVISEAKLTTHDTPHNILGEEKKASTPHLHHHSSRKKHKK